MKILAIRTASALVYLLLAYVGAIAVWFAPDASLTLLGFFSWNIACAGLFAYAVSRLTGRSPAYTLPVVLVGSLIQTITVHVIAMEVLGETLTSILLDHPMGLVPDIDSQPLLNLMWFGLPVLSACIVLYLNRSRSRVDAMHT